MWLFRKILPFNGLELAKGQGSRGSLADCHAP